MDLGSTIRELRKKQNMKQSELAEKAGISRVAIGNYERNDRNPNIEILLKISNALKVPVTDLLESDDYDTISLIAKKTHTHPAYVRGETDEPNFKRYYLESLIKDLNFSKFKESVSIYPYDLQNTILILWGSYLVNMISDWYYSDDNISGKDIDLIYFADTTHELYKQFRDYLNSLTVTFEGEKIINHKIDIDDMRFIYKQKTDLLNSISDLIDKTISNFIVDQNEDASLFISEIIKKYGDNIENI